MNSLDMMISSISSSSSSTSPRMRRRFAERLNDYTMSSPDTETEAKRSSTAGKFKTLSSRGRGGTLLSAYLLGALSVHLFYSFYLNNNSVEKNIVPSVKETMKYDRCDSSQDFFDVFHPMGTDKTSRHGYHWFYGPHLQRFRTKPDLKILEIGAKEGRSTAGWTKYFSDASVDVITYGGAKNNLAFNRMECKLGDCSKVTRFEGDQSDTDFLDRVLKQRQSGWDIIIDDASHVPAHNIITFEHLWKNVRPGGLYVVEDIETSYYPKGEVYGYNFEAGMLAPSEQNAMIRFQKYADVMNRGYFPANVKDFSLLEGDHLIEEVGYSRNIIYVQKAASCSIANRTSLDYPQGPVPLPGKETITESVEEAKKLFMKGTKYLENWYTAPSVRKGK